MGFIPQTVTDQQVRAIRADKRHDSVVAADYGISRGYVGQIKSGFARGDVEPKLEWKRKVKPYKKGKNNKRKTKRVENTKAWNESVFIQEQPVKTYTEAQVDAMLTDAMETAVNTNDVKCVSDALLTLIERSPNREATRWLINEYSELQQDSEKGE